MALDVNLFLSVLNIIAIDLILGGDNAVVIALACRKLPENKRNRAILLGTGLAVILRVILTAMMVSLLKVPYLLLIGGLLLIVIAYKLLADKDHELDVKAGTTLISAIRTIVFADLIMGLDNIIGIAGASKGNMMLVILGLLVSVPIIIWGSKIILAAMEHIPGLVYLGGAILAYTASSMITEEPKVQTVFSSHPELKLMFTIMVVLSVLLSGWIKNRIQSDAHSHS